MRINSRLLAATIGGLVLSTASAAIAGEAIDQRGSISAEGPTILEGMSLTVTVNGQRYEKSSVDEMARGPFTLEWAVAQDSPDGAVGPCPEGAGIGVVAGGSTPAVSARATSGSFADEGPFVSPEISEQRRSVALAICADPDPDPGPAGQERGARDDEPKGPPAHAGNPKKGKPHPHPSRGDEHKHAASTRGKHGPS